MSAVPPEKPPLPRLRLDRFKPGRRHPLVAVVVAFAALTILLVLLAAVLRRRPARTEPAAQSPGPAAETTHTVAVLRSGEAMPALLARAAVPAELTPAVVSALSYARFNLRAMRPGDSLTACWIRNRPVRLYYYRSPELIYRVDIDSPACRVATVLRPVVERCALVAGSITSSLYEAVLTQGEKPGLVADYTDIFGWEIDFFSETQRGDSFLVLAVKRFIDSSFIGYGPILAARYRGPVGSFSAFRYTDPTGRTDFYNPEGQSLRKTFLKSPLHFSRISSFFGSRRHPILRARRMHHGLDYVAPIGTPVSCVADGRVTVAGWSGGYGRLVEVTHPNGVVTRYGHLSNFGRGVRAGANVVQGQVIGYVGSTGLSTGPHLHYEVHRGGGSVNPMRLDPPRREPVPPEFQADFAAVRDSLDRLLSRPPTPPPAR